MEKHHLEKRKLNSPFLALGHKNFRLYWIGMCVSTIGTWMQNAAQPQLAFALTGSPFLVSLVAALQFIPVLLFSMFAGVFIDKFNKKKILIFTQSALLLITMALAILAMTGKIRFWHIAFASAMIGITNTLDMPTRQAFVIELVGKENLMNAIALNSSVFNISRIIGPAIAGVVMQTAGYPACFLSNSISFAAVLISLFFIKPIPMHMASKAGNKVLAEIKDGLKYILRQHVLLDTLLIMAATGTFASTFSSLLPVFSAVILHHSAWYSYLLSFMGCGSLVGALCIAMVSKAGPKRFVLYTMPFIVGALFIGIGFTNAFILTGIVLAVTGFFFVIFTSSANTTIQLNTSNEYRGRIMSFYSLVFGGFSSLGNLYAGAITEHFGARIGFAACGGNIIVLMFILRLCFAGRDKRKAAVMPEAV